MHVIGGCLELRQKDRDRQAETDRNRQRQIEEDGVEESEGGSVTRLPRINYSYAPLGPRTRQQRAGADRYANTRGIKHVHDSLRDRRGEEVARERRTVPLPARRRRDGGVHSARYEDIYFRADSAGSRQWWRGNKRRLSRQIASS